MITIASKQISRRRAARLVYSDIFGIWGVVFMEKSKELADLDSREIQKATKIEKDARNFFNSLKNINKEKEKETGTIIKGAKKVEDYQQQKAPGLIILGILGIFGRVFA